MTEPTNEQQKIGITEERPTPVTFPVTLIWSDKFEMYEGDANSLQPQRLIQAYEQLKTIGGLEWSSLQCIEPDSRLGNLDTLLDFHRPAYCQSIFEWHDQNVKELWHSERCGFRQRGTRPFVGMAEVAQQYVSATRSAVRFAINQVEKPINVVCFAGEQPHAYPEKANNGDIFNDIALALLDADKLTQKIAFINLDAEHPTVIQDLFFSNSNVMVISLHEHPFFLYPSTGETGEIGRGKGHGYNINIPLPPGAGDEQLDQAFEQVIHPLLEQFAPNLVIMLGGPSAHISESLAHLRLTTYGYQKMVDKLATITSKFVLLGGSGSDWEVSARLWVLAIATLTRQITQIDQTTTSLKPNEPSHTFRINMLHDKPIAPLSTSMEEYINFTFRSTLLGVQQQIFPLWDIPISLDEIQVSTEVESLIENATTEPKIGHQVEQKEGEKSAKTHVDIRNENENKDKADGKEKTIDPKTTAHSLNETQISDPPHPSTKLTDRSIPQKEKNKVRHTTSGLQIGKSEASATSQTPPKQPKSPSNRPKRLPSRRRKRSRSRRKRSGGK